MNAERPAGGQAERGLRSVSDELDDEREHCEARDDARKEEALGEDVVVSHGSTVRGGSQLHCDYTP